MKFVAIGLLLGLVNIPTAPSPDPHRDHRCMNPAYVKMHQQECQDAVDPRNYDD